ncbi:tautomerase family protein [Nocardia sp. CA-107356]|uniref:tautomerase family protein n=1 Tax=Nocardia sp. CA-107356 TaxID=3239972 RepID=UPI003D90DE49
MPFAEIYLRDGTTPEYRKAISAGIHQSMIEVFQIPEDDFFHVIHSLPAENMLHAPVFWGIGRSDESVIIRMTFNVRPAEQKKALFTTIADRLVENPGLRRDDILMTILETAAENWWSTARTIDPETGFDTRMSPEAVRAGTIN